MSASSSSRSSLGERRYASPEPPLSPTLPSPVTKARKPRPVSRMVIALRWSGLMCAALFVWWTMYSLPCVHLLGPDTAGVELSTSNATVAYATKEPVVSMVPSLHGPRWTVSIPRNANFPLPGRQYAQICKQAEKLRNDITSSSKLAYLSGWHSESTRRLADPTFVDVEHAGRSIVFPGRSVKPGHDICHRSLTFALDDNDASFGKTLLLLWMSYGLAKKEGRAFFIDDSRWAYGKYSSYFVPPPEPSCRPPPPDLILPCPHNAKHVIVSSATAQWTFGPVFENAFIDPRERGVKKSSAIFHLLRTGYEDLFHIAGEDALYASSRNAKMREDAESHGGVVAGIHVRRGDLHPFEYQFSKDYLPLERYAHSARRLLRSLLASRVEEHATDGSGDDFSAVTEFIRSPLLVASDDPDVISSPELLQAAAPFSIQRAQERIHLATKAILDKTSPAVPIREPGSAYVKHVDENTGWEGGFYSALFYTLGGSKRERSSGEQATIDGVEPLPEQSLRIRELVGRAYLLDLAVLGSSDGVVCAVSSAACRILGVMLGWDAVVEGRWVNVDNGRPWSWNGHRS